MTVQWCWYCVHDASCAKHVGPVCIFDRVSGTCSGFSGSVPTPSPEDVERVKDAIRPFIKASIEPFLARGGFSFDVTIEAMAIAAIMADRGKR